MAPARTTTQVRRATTSSVHDEKSYEAVVVGAGPAGVTCMGNLLERKLSPILWVDDAFNGGRVNSCYREVPSNTKVGLFIDFATATAPFRKIVKGVPSRSRWDESSDEEAASNKDEKSDKLSDLRQLDQGKGCRLSHAADMSLMLTEGLRRMPEVVSRESKVTEAVFDESSSEWTVKIDGLGSPVRTKRLVLCTGSSPNNSPLPVNIPGAYSLDLDCALSPSLLTTSLSSLGPTTVSVIGASHSAIIVLMNLYQLASQGKQDLKIRWFTRHPLRYAEYKDGWILRDNTGLKGEAATWAKNNLEPEVFEQSDVSKYMTKIRYQAGAEKETFVEHLTGSDFYVQAIGYDRNPLPTLRTSTGKKITPQFDHEKGSFNYVTEAEDESVETPKRLPGMFGAGIAWPERVKDPLGNVEYAVGFWKFMKFVRRVSPEWN